jgi:hypothetical protein
MIPLSLVALAAAATPAGCADAIRFDLDPGWATTDFGRGRIPAARLEPFRRQAAKVFREAADGLCARKAIPARDVAALRRVVIQNGAGATETVLYVAPEFGPHSIVFQWTFAEGPLSVPPRRDVESALLCWAHPRRKGCDAPGD